MDKQPPNGDGEHALESDEQEVLSNEELEQVTGGSIAPFPPLPPFPPFPG